MDCSP